MRKPWELPPDTQLPADICGHWAFPSNVQPGKDDIMQIQSDGRLVQIVYISPEESIPWAGIRTWVAPQGDDPYLVLLELTKPGKPMQFRVEGDTLVIDGPDRQWIGTRYDSTQLPEWFPRVMAHHHARMDKQEARARETAPSEAAPQ